ncbi:MAG: ATP-binding protein [Acidobacteriota bacterium]
MSTRPRSNRRLSHERRILLYALGAGLPGVVVTLAILWSGEYSAKVQWTLTLFVLGGWLGFAFAAFERTILPLQTIANLLEALREGDYSIRARQADRGDALGEVMVEVNELGEILRHARFGIQDATTLLEEVIQNIDVAVFSIDVDGTVSLVNREAERLMARGADELLGRPVADLGLADLLEGAATRTVERTFAGKSGRWQLRRSNFHADGRPHNLLVLTDLSQALREEERQAWQRLIRVLGHELNNSLAPMKSTAMTLADLLRRRSDPEHWRDDAERGLVRIAERCESLHRFVAGYSRLARLPAPNRQPTPLQPLVERAVAAVVGGRDRTTIEDGDELTLDLDRDQIEQLLINLIKNAVEAVDELDETSPPSDAITLSWSASSDRIALFVRDSGPGLANPTNAFVPFFTTKEGGTGIGLVLCRQIAEAHGGALTLSNRADATGCEARLELPRERPRTT